MTSEERNVYNYTFNQETSSLTKLAMSAGQGVEEVEGGGEGGGGKGGIKPQDAREDGLNYLHHGCGFLAQQTPARKPSSGGMS